MKSSHILFNGEAVKQNSNNIIIIYYYYLYVFVENWSTWIRDNLKPHDANLGIKPT